MDHTMQLGERKCLIVVGIRQSAWKAQDRVLGHEDLELIDLVPVTSVYEELSGQIIAAAIEVLNFNVEKMKDGITRLVL